MAFKDIIGQDKPTQLLQETIRGARLSNAYLFVGPEAIGKFQAAFTLAKAVNCEQEELDSCDRCESCLKIDKRTHPDVHIIDASANAAVDSQGIRSQTTNSEAIKIEQIRQLKHSIAFKPYEGKKKVFIIDNAHNLTAEASNALLKILEEPPADSLLILVSSKPALLFETIVSRCQRVKFYPLSRKELERALREEHAIAESQAHFLAYFCEGRLGAALKLKDADILLKKNRIIDQFILSRRPDFADTASLDRASFRWMLNVLASWLRDLYIVKIGSPHSELINCDRKDALLKNMARLSFVELDEKINFIAETITYLEQNVNVKLLLSNLRSTLWNN